MRPAPGSREPPTGFYRHPHTRQATGRCAKARTSKPRMSKPTPDATRPRLRFDIRGFVIRGFVRVPLRRRVISPNMRMTERLERRLCLTAVPYHVTLAQTMATTISPADNVYSHRSPTVTWAGVDGARQDHQRQRLLVVRLGPAANRLRLLRRPVHQLDRVGRPLRQGLLHGRQGRQRL